MWLGTELDIRNYGKTSLIAYRRETNSICNTWGYAINELYHTAKMWNMYDVYNVSLVISDLGEANPAVTCGLINLEVFWKVWNRRWRWYFGDLPSLGGSYKWYNRACAMIPMERREEYLFPIRMFSSLPYSPHSAQRPTVLPLISIPFARTLSFSTVSKGPYSPLRYLPLSSLRF